MNTIMICSKCQINPVEEEYKEEEMCSYCISEIDDSDNTMELNFDKPERRKDDRMVPEPEDNWNEEDEDV